MNIALVGCLGVFALSSASLAMDDEWKAGRSILEESDQEVLDAYWWKWRSAVAGPVGVCWRWNLDQLHGFWSLGIEQGGDIETRVERYQQWLDKLWADYEHAVVQNENGEQSWFLWGLSEQGIEQLDPDKNRVFDPVVEFRNGRELIRITDIEIEGDQITMVFPDGKGKIVAQENEKGQLVGLWNVADGLGETQEYEFIGYPRYNQFCWTNGVWLSQEMVEILNGSWKMEFENLGSASCEFDVLSLDPGQYKEEWRDGFRTGVPQEYSRVIANITTDQGVMNNLVGIVKPYKRKTSEESFKMYFHYFDGKHAMRLIGELESDGSLVGTMISTRFGEDTWIAHQEVLKTRSDKKKP